MDRISNIWKGEDVIIIGGGPSLIDAFNIPVDVVRAVRTGESSLSAYSVYMKEIHHKRVIGINMAYQLGDWVDVCFFGDRGFHTLANNFDQFKGRVITCNPYYKTREERVEYIGCHITQKTGISPRPDRICWNYSSGNAAIDLAVKMGAKSIELIGFDAALSNTGDEHWHSQYLRMNKADHKSENRKPNFHLFKDGIKALTSDLKELGIQIYNRDNKTQNIKR